MAVVYIYSQEDNRTYQVAVEPQSAVMHDINGSPSDATVDYYLKISTSIRHPNGSLFPDFVVRTVADVPPGYPVASNFTELINNYIEYFVVGGELGQSSSSSSSSDSSSSSLSSSSSSHGYSFSSVSSSSKSSESSSSSSGYIPVTLGAGSSYTLPTYEETRGVEITYTGGLSSTADVTLDGDTFQIANVAGSFVWDSDNMHSNLHTFTFIGESWPQTVGLKIYTIIWQGVGSLIVSVQKTGQHSSSSQSSSSSSSYGGLPKTFKSSKYEIFR